jgi:hypothetical protein
MADPKQMKPAAPGDKTVPNCPDCPNHSAMPMADKMHGKIPRPSNVPGKG